MESILDINVKERLRNVLISNDKIEIEARFTDYQSARGIDSRTFDRLITLYDNKGNRKETTLSEDQNYNPESLRLTVIRGGDPILMRKTKVEGFPIFVRDFGIKIGVSTEEVLESTEESLNDFRTKVSLLKESMSIRIKNRSSYFFSNGNQDQVRLDLTKVDMIFFDDKSRSRLSNTNYEVELELLHPSGLDFWYGLIPMILSEIQDTEIIYTKDEYNTIMSSTNENLGGVNSKESSINSRYLMDARNLKYKDLVYGGIYGGPVNYRISVKSDGFRKLLVISKSGIWLLWNTEANKVYSTGGVSGVTRNEFLDNYNGYIFDGELIPIDARKDDTVKQKYWYLIFDVLCRNVELSNKVIADQSIRRISHLDRMATGQVVINNLSSDKYSNETESIRRLIMINTKTFWILEDFFNTNREAESYRRICKYKDDGFIFVPNNSPYERTMGELYERVLTRQSDICKWKKEEDITFDFLVSYLMSKDGSRKMIIQGHNANKRIYLVKFKQDGSSSVALNPVLYSFFQDIKIVKYGNGKITYTFPEKFDMSKVKTNSLVNFTWNDKTKVYVGKVLPSGRSDPINVIKTRMDNLQDFRVYVEWVNMGNDSKMLQMYCIDSANPYETIDKPIDSDNILLKDIPAGLVVEFRWDGNKFVPVRKRYNKKYPNNMSTINDNLHLISDPIELETLLGETIRLMRKSHNAIKSQLYSESLGDNLLDLGSGFGGDYSKWNNYKKIIAVEPSAGHINEFKRRLSDYFKVTKVKVIESSAELTNLDRDRVIILKTGAENYELISAAVEIFFKGKADVVAMMLSLSFFWLQKDLLPRLIRTVDLNLKVGGKFIYLTIDGEKVRNTFDPVIKGPIIDEIKLFNGNVVMKYVKESNTLEVLFKGTIVQAAEPGEEKGQIESLVILNDLRREFRNIGILEQYWKEANTQGLLNVSERQLTNLYSYGSFIRSSTESVTGFVPKQLIRGSPAKPLECRVKNDGTIVEEPKVKMDIKWYLDSIYRNAMVNYDDEMTNLLGSILRFIYYSKGLDYPNNAYERYDLIIKKKEEIKTDVAISLDIDSNEISFQDKIIKLGKYFQMDISVVEISSTNIIPLVTKYFNFPYGIILGKLKDTYENIGVSREGKLHFIFQGRGAPTPDPFYGALTAVTLLSKIPEDKIEPLESDMLKVTSGGVTFSIITAFKQLAGL